jgi:exopolysaccharide production protein ExoY
MNNSNCTVRKIENRMQSLPFLNLNCQIRHIFFKRVFDFFFSLSILIFGIPLFIIIGILIRCTSRGPILYFQERIGRGGTPFKCYKFRTMHPDADERLQTILSSDPLKYKEWQVNHKLKDDPRITYIGNFLRKTSLDELPQFWNVLKGDLSVVGPRPVVYEEIIRHYGPKAYKILSIRPGLTGIWQISGRGNTGYAKRILLDEQYVDTRSFALDIKIIIKTIPSMISAKGAY